ncbi:polymer biosynthesis protein, WecB/TagA/CpsF family [Loktanella atrilutea]|uniref:Polymer biosynthesis protein, WecB/TagA/CpsF family n=1 Tax=Loktanella atrilutea TaxID=366533 RepID=A0A1M4XL10_LOKAT|nr:WecB/TagA/CpsF family glycosyltransferase [Loktanella atrilutea]SHE94185.1 polymer biosynthesis protein, WecB/TagA/CpsF family [Loktanella atrilutea]
MKHATFDFLTTPDAFEDAQSYLPALDLTLLDSTAERAVDLLLSPGKRTAFFINAHCCNVMHRDRTYMTAVRCADVLLPDGIGIALAGRMTGQRLAGNLNGTDLIPALLARAAKTGKAVYLFGGTPGTADAAAATLIRRIPHLRVVGTRDGFDGAQDTDAVIADINASGADIVLVALGVPLQEIWIHRNAHRIDAQLVTGVGAALDFLAGNVSRAPLWLRRARSEWIWRLAQEPRRLARRYLAGNFTFMARAGATVLRRVSGASVARRALDITVAGFACVALAPVLALTALAIKADSQGPVLFRQTRIGQNGRPFTIYKFRSMAQDAEARRAALLATSDREGVCFKSKSDPRITKVGKVIRRLSIDELPQILNVLRGEMAIVGPRPALPDEVAAYPARAMGRLAVKPGITGLWQVSGRADIAFDQMIDMDLTYARSRTILLDLMLIALTFRAVVSGRGAH